MKHPTDDSAPLWRLWPEVAAFVENSLPSASTRFRKGTTLTDSSPIMRPVFSLQEEAAELRMEAEQESAGKARLEGEHYCTTNLKISTDSRELDVIQLCHSPIGQ